MHTLSFKCFVTLNTLRKDGFFPYLLSRFFAGESERGSRL
jgi:hypothetical protein